MTAPPVLVANDAMITGGTDFVPVAAAQAAAEPARRVAAASLLAAVATAQVLWFALLAFGVYYLLAT